MEHIRGNSAKEPSLRSGRSSIPVVGIAGTAKNTGKTTSLNALLEASQRHGRVAAVTSIGYDGEAIDSITGLPKPRVVLPPGSIATTARSCVPDRGWSLLTSAGCANALGEVVIVRCEVQDKLVLAGPNKLSDLLRVVRQMSDLSPGIILIDGALNRIAPLAAAESLILATGGARSTDIPSLCREMRGAEEVFLPATAPLRPTPEYPLPFREVEDEVHHVLTTCLDREHKLRIPGFMGEKTLSNLAATLSATGAGRKVTVREVVFRDPFTLVLAAAMENVGAYVRAIRRAGVLVSFEHPIRLLAVTVNPFYPELKQAAYQAASISGPALLAAMREALSIPVVDVMAEGVDRLWAASTGVERPRADVEKRPFPE